MSVISKRLVPVQFDVSGLDQTLVELKKISAAKKRQLEIEKETLGAMKEGTEQYEKQQNRIERLQVAYKKTDDAVKQWGEDMNTVRDIVNNIDEQGPKMLLRFLNSSTRMIKNIKEFGDEMKDKVGGLAEARNVARALFDAYIKGATNLKESLKDGLSYTELQGYVQAYEKDGKIIAEAMEDYGASLAKLGEIATDAKLKMAEMDGTIKEMNEETSKADLSKMEQFFGGLKDYAGATQKQITSLTKKWREAQDFLYDQHQNTIDHPDTFSVEEIKQSIDWMEKYQKSLPATDEAQSGINANIADGRRYLEEFARANKKAMYEHQLGVRSVTDSTGEIATIYKNIHKLSDEALVSQTKFWEEEMRLADRAAKPVNDYQSRIKAIKQEQKSRINNDALNFDAMYGTDTAKLSMSQLNEGIDIFQRKLANMDPGSAFDITSKRLKEMQDRLVLLKTGFSDVDQLIEKTGKLGTEGFSYTTTEIEGMRKALVEYQKQVNDPKGTGKDQFDKLQESIQKCDDLLGKHTRVVKEGIKDIDNMSDEEREAYELIRKAAQKSSDAVRELFESRKVTLEDLTRAQKIMLEEVKSGKFEQEFDKVAASVRNVDENVQNLNKQLKHHVSTLDNAIDRLKNYVLVYVGAAKAFDKLKEVVQQNIKYADSLSNVQKVSGLTRDETNRLSKAIQHLNTRTAQEELLALGVAGGKLGVAAEYGAAGLSAFIESANTMMASLGEDLGGAEAITSLMKVNQIMGNIEKGNAESIKESLNATASAILRIGNTSTASYGYVAQFTGRLGGTAAQAGLTMDQLLGLAGAMDTANVACEMGATAMQRFLVQLRMNPEGIAKAIGGSEADLKRMRDENDTMGEMLYVLDKLRGVKLEETSSIIKALMGGGKNQQQSLTALNSLIAQQDTLRDLLATSADAYNEASAATLEYDIMNRNAAGSVERMGNAIRNQLVNSDFTTIIEDLLAPLVPFFEHLDDYKVRIVMWITAIAIAFKTNFDLMSMSFGNLKAAMIKGVREISAAFAKAGITLVLMAIADAIGTVIDKIRTETQLLNECTKGVIEATKKYVEQQGAMRKLCDRHEELRTQQKKNSKETTEYDRVTRQLLGTLQEYYSLDELIKQGIADKTGAILDEKKAYDLLAISAQKAAMAEVGAAIKADNSKKAYNAFVEDQEKFSQAFDEILKFIPENERSNYNKSDIMEQNYKNWMESATNGTKYMADPRVAEAYKRAQDNGMDVSNWINLTGTNLGAFVAAGKDAIIAYNTKGINGQSINSFDAAAEAAGTSFAQSFTSGVARDIGAWNWMTAGLGNVASGQKWSKDNSFLVRMNSGTNTASWSIPGIQAQDAIGSNNLYNANKTVDEIFGNYTKKLQAGDEGDYTPQITPDKTGSEHKHKRRMEDIDLARKRIEEYYKQVEDTYTVLLNSGKMMQSDFNALIFQNRQNLLADQQRLEKKFLNTSQTFSTADVDKFMAETEGPNGTMVPIDYQAINAFLGTNDGKRYLGQINFNIDKFGAEIQKNLREQNEKIQKVLLEQRPIANLAKAWLKDLDELYLLPSTAGMTMEDATRETAQRLSFLLEEAKKGYALTMDEFMKDMRKNGYGSWADLLDGDDDKKRALLLKVQDFTEQYEDAVRKMMTTIGKRVDQEWARIDETTGKSLNQMFEDSARHLSNQQTSQSQADSWGFTGRNLEGIGDTDKLKIQQLQQTVDLELERLRIVKERGDAEYAAALRLAEAEQDPKLRAELFKEAEAEKEAALRATTEQWEKVMEVQREATQGHLDQLSNAIGQAQPYYETMYSWAEQMGLNMFGSKADRQQASRELIAGLIDTTGKMLTQWLVYISTKQMFDKMEIAQEAAKQAQLNALRYEAMAEKLQAAGQEELATLALQESANQADQAAAAGKEAAKSGWIGWATGAALTLVMGALMAAASAKVKSTVASVTGVSAGKLTTGMLTYAKGLYPTYSEGTGMTEGQRYEVAGTDGNTYQARYKPRLTTGKYATPHMGIVGEKGAELIVDHPTLSTLEREAPWVLQSIYDAHRYRRLSLNHAALHPRIAPVANQVRTYAAGNLDAVPGASASGFSVGQVPGASASGSIPSGYSASVPDASASGMLAEALRDFTALLATIQRNGIQARISKYGKGGLMEEIRSGERFYKSVGK